MENASLKEFKNIKLLEIKRDKNGYKIDNTNIAKRFESFINVPIIDYSTINDSPFGEPEHIIGYIDKVTHYDEEYVYGNIKVFAEDINEIKFKTYCLSLRAPIESTVIYHFDLMIVYVDVTRDRECENE